MHGTVRMVMSWFSKLSTGTTSVTAHKWNLNIQPLDGGEGLQLGWITAYWAQKFSALPDAVISIHSLKFKLLYHNLKACHRLGKTIHMILLSDSVDKNKDAGSR